MLGHEGAAVLRLLVAAYYPGDVPGCSSHAGQHEMGHTEGMPTPRCLEKEQTPMPLNWGFYMERVTGLETAL